MTGFFTWPEAFIYLLTLLLAFNVLSQTVLMVLSFLRYPQTYTLLLESIMEVVVLFVIVIFSLMHGQMIHSFDTTVIAPTGYEVLRIVAFILTTLTGLVLAVIMRKPSSLFIVLFSLPLLSFLEINLTKGFAYLFISVIIGLLIRSVLLSLQRLKEIRNRISASSVKNTIDSIHTAVLFSEQDGLILLINEQMLQLMSVISGKLQRNAIKFYDFLATGELATGMKRDEFEGQIVFHLQDETTWIFSRNELKIKTKNYFQLTATDITRQWNLTAELQRQEKELKIKSEQLRESIDKLQILSSERVVQKAKLRVHEVLGQRLSFLLGSIRSEESLDQDLLSSFSQNILEDLKLVHNLPSPKDELDSLRQAFTSIGVSIEVEGELPADQEISHTFTDIIKESVTNAVRHGFATKVLVSISEKEDGHHMTIMNNGDLPSGPVIEGGGIGAMRSMLEAYGGDLEVSINEYFALTIKLPRGKNEL